MTSVIEGGFPHSEIPDQSLFAAPRGLSQRTTSFIASQRQGIHRMPLRHLIALIINAHPSASIDWQSRSRIRTVSSIRLSVGYQTGRRIRKSADQSLFAAPHGLSQRTTSFIASQRQGIHRIPLRHLIALIIDAHRSAVAGSHLHRRSERHIDRKTSLLQMHPRTSRSSDVHCWYARRRPQFDRDRHDDRMHFLFTMSDNPQTRIAGRPASCSSTRQESLCGRRSAAGGARRDRTDDLLLAKQALSQLSYGPEPSAPSRACFEGLNGGPGKT